MITKVHCPRCHTPLRVPESASGQAARCPSCRQVFKVPEPEELFEETISTWIEDDLAAMENHQQQYWDNIGRRASRFRHIMPSEEADVSLRLTEADDDDSPDESAEAAPATQPAAEKAAVDKANDGSTTTTEKPKEKKPQDKPKTTPPRPSKKRPARAPSASTGSQGTVEFNMDVTSVGDRPFLAVEKCTAAGVTLAFDSRWLEHPQFRASVPVCCAVTGEDAVEKLRARPLVFVDQSSGQIRSPQTVESKYEQRILSGQTPADLVRSMELIDGLPRPYNRPLPYYIDEHHTHLSLRCTTRKRDDGGMSCLVECPHGWMALEWLARVNGICGPEYEALESQVGTLASEAWTELTEQCRERIEIWCHFEPGEQFVTYVSDADFGSRERGLAGLVITDRRLIYCKYHHRGAIDLHQPGRLIVKPDGRWANLAWEADGRRVKIVKVLADDVAQVAAELDEFDHIDIHQTD